MRSVELAIARTDPSGLIVQSLPDGSAAIFEVATSNVYSLNTSAAAAWEACAAATTLPEIAGAMSSRLKAPVTEDLAHAAVSELEAAGLVRVKAPEGFRTSRRDLLKQVAGVAIPMVLILTGAEQRAFAQQNGSGPITTPPPTTTQPPVTTTQPPVTTTQPVGNATFCIVKRISPPDPPEPIVLAVGFTFELRSTTGPLVLSRVTGSDGRAEWVDIPAGSYQLVETNAPGGPYEPFDPVPVVLASGANICLDLVNNLANP
jgi:hypothetical protein